MKAKNLAIIILQHNTPEHVSNNLAKLQQAELPENTEIIVVNNGGNQANQKVKSESYNQLNVKFFDTPNHGFPAGNNFGMEQLQNPISKYDFIAFINPDIQIQPKTLKHLIEYMEAKPNVGITSPKLVYPDGVVQDNYRVFPKPLDLVIKRVPFLRKRFTNRMRKYLMWDRKTNSNQAVDWVTGAFTLFSSKCLQSVGEHNQKDYFLFMSDVEICRKAWEEGYEVHIVGSTKALHNDQRVSSGGMKDIFTKKIIRIHIWDSIKYFAKNIFKPLPKNAPSNQTNS